MADPLSVLGATAAALQIASQAFELVKYLSGLYGKIKDAPELKQTRISHLEQLIELSKLIAKTPPLQTVNVQKVLVSCLRTIMKLRDLLDKYSPENHGKVKKIVNALKIGNKEDDIAMLLEAIEKEKSLLALSIHQIDSTQLATVNIKVTQLQTSFDNSSLIISDTAQKIQTMVEILPDIGNQVESVYQGVPKLAAGIEAIQEKLRVTSISTTIAMEPPKCQIYEVPNRRVREFVGRESVLAQIEASFSSESEIGPRIVVLRAMGGQGKTQVALEYCRRTRQKTVTAVFWVDASSESSLKQSYSTISEALGSQAEALPDVDARVNFTLRKLKAWRSPWLIVLDNYDNPVEFNNIKDYIPECEQGMVLVTSRHADADVFAKEENRIQLPGLLDSDAIELLLNQRKGQQMDHTASDYAKVIVERLGYHPLAIAQAGAYINKLRLPLEEFLDHFQRRKAIILKDTTPQMSQYRRKLGGTERETSLSVFTTWELSYQQLLSEDTDKKCMADLLTLLAFFAAGGVSERLLKGYFDSSEAGKSPCNNLGSPKSPHEGQELFRIQEVGDRQKHAVPGAFLSLHGDTWDSDLYCDALSAMSQLSLVEGFAKETDGMYKATLHPLVRDWIRLRTGKIPCADYTYLVATCIRRLVLSGTKNDYFNMGFSIGQDVLKHLDAHRMNMEDFFPQGSDVLDEKKRLDLEEFSLDCGRFYLQFGDYAKAAEVLKQCLVRRNNGPEENNLLTRRLLVGLGDALVRLGQYKEGEYMVRNALSMAIEAHGEEHEETTSYMTRLSNVLLYQPPNEESEEYVRKCLRLNEMLHGKEDRRTLNCMSSLGYLLDDQKKVTEAEEVFRQTLKLQKTVLGKENPDTLDTMHNLAYILCKPEELIEREDLFRQVLDIEEKVYGKEHPSRMQTMTNLASTMVDMGRYGEAEEMYLESMKSLEGSVGNRHPVTIYCASNYGVLLRIKGRYLEALSLSGRAFTASLELFGPRHTRTSYYESSLCRLINDVKNEIKDLVNAGQYGEAEEIYIQSKNSVEGSFGKIHRFTLSFISNYGRSLCQAGRYMEALPLIDEVYTMTLHSLGPHHADTLRRKQRLESLLEHMKKTIENIIDKGEHDEAENMYVRCIKSMETSLGKSHRYTLRFITYYGSILGKAGRYRDALPVLETAYTRFNELHGPRHPSTMYRERLLNELLVEMKKDTGVGHSKEDRNLKDEFT